MLTVFVTGGLLTFFYIWKQDLLANIIAHVVTDSVGIIVMPFLAHTQ
jgi:membrane protease YdiL (CAAX protease family)